MTIATRKRYVVGSSERAATILAAFMRHKQLTKSQLAKALHLTKIDHLTLWIDQWYDQGVIYICGWMSKYSPIYALQPNEPFGIPDIEYTDPVPATPCEALPGEYAVRYLYNGKRMTVRELANEIGMTYSTLRTRLKVMSVAHAVLKPVRKSGRSEDL